MDIYNIHTYISKEINTNRLKNTCKEFAFAVIIDFECTSSLSLLHFNSVINYSIH